jgi:hypothetical protein
MEENVAMGRELGDSRLLIEPTAALEAAVIVPARAVGRTGHDARGGGFFTAFTPSVRLLREAVEKGSASVADDSRLTSKQATRPSQQYGGPRRSVW